MSLRLRWRNNTALGAVAGVELEVKPGLPCQWAILRVGSSTEVGDNREVLDRGDAVSAECAKAQAELSYFEMFPIKTKRTTVPPAMLGSEAR